MKKLICYLLICGMMLSLAVPTLAKEKADLNAPKPVPYEMLQPGSYVKGDVDYNGKVDAVDALVLLKVAVAKLPAGNVEMAVADMDNDKKIDAADALIVLKIAVNKQEPLPPYVVVTPTDVTGTDVTFTDLMVGDVNGDKMVHAADSLDILKYAANLLGFSPRQKTAADVNQDGEIDVVDAMEILHYASRQPIPGQCNTKGILSLVCTEASGSVGIHIDTTETKIGAMEFTLTYDPALIQPTYFTRGLVLEDSAALCTYSRKQSADGKTETLTVHIATHDGFGVSGALCTVDFQAMSQFQGAAPIDLEVVKVQNHADPAVKYNITTMDGQITPAVHP